MQIGFFAQGEGPHLQIAKHLIATARKVMPGVAVYQLTDADTKVLDGAQVKRIGGDWPMGVRRMLHYAEHEGDWLYCDTDILFKKDVRSVFETPFDIALASRDGTYMQGTPYARLMPYNFGVLFSRNRDFWRQLLPHLKRLPRKAQEWGGEQQLLCEAVKIDGPYKIEVLPCAYNFTPYQEQEDVSHASILHLKGPRKAWITTYL